MVAAVVVVAVMMVVFWRSVCFASTVSVAGGVEVAVVVVDLDVAVDVAVVAVERGVAAVVVVVLYHIAKGCPHPPILSAIPAVRAADIFALQQPPECVLSPPPQNERWVLLSPATLSRG